MAMTETRMTVEEFIDAVANLRERAQLIDGVMVVDQHRFRHQDVVGEISSALGAWQRAAPGRGQTSLPLDVILDRHGFELPLSEVFRL